MKIRIFELAGENPKDSGREVNSFLEEVSKKGEVLSVQCTTSSFKDDSYYDGEEVSLFSRNSYDIVVGYNERKID